MKKYISKVTYIIVFCDSIIPNKKSAMIHPTASGKPRAKESPEVVPKNICGSSRIGYSFVYECACIHMTLL
jgi:hypothetical protein